MTVREIETRSPKLIKAPAKAAASLPRALPAESGDQRTESAERTASKNVQ